MKIIFAVVLSLGMGVSAAAVELITNGDFEASLDIGWHERVINANDGYWEIARDTIYDYWGYNGDHDSDYEATVFKGRDTLAELSQTVELPSLDLDFSITCAVEAFADAYVLSLGAVTVEYEDSAGTPLGGTVIYCAVPFDYIAPDCDTTTTHLYPATIDRWDKYKFNIAQELAHLSGVNPQAVKKLRVALSAFGMYLIDPYGMIRTSRATVCADDISLVWEPGDILESTPAPPLLSLSAVPSPVKTTAKISYTTPSFHYYKLAVYDILGKRVRTLYAGKAAENSQVLTWDGRDEIGQQVSPGVYFVRLDAGDRQLVRKLTYVGK